MEIKYLKIRGAAITILIWTAIISAIGYLRAEHLTYTWIKPATEMMGQTVELGVICLLWFLGLLFILCLADW
jgi:hypothetical protein